MALISHSRTLLWHSGDISCDYADERIFLRKVGGGYIFIHRMLLEYFASLETQPNADGNK